MSASLGAVFVANPENLAKDAVDRGQRVEPTVFYLVEQPAQLGILAHRLLEVAPRARRRDAEHLLCEVTPAPRLQLTLLLEPGAVREHLLPQRLDALAAQRLRQDDRRPPALFRPERKHLPHLVQHR